MQTARWAWLVAGLWLSPAVARSDDTHYHDYPLGGRAVGLGGAYVALSDDPSGIFYNPAGTVDIRRISVQVSSNLYGLEISRGFDFELEELSDLTTFATQLNIIPSSASFLSVLEEDRRGRPITTYGFGVFVPSYRSQNTRSLTELPRDRAPNSCTSLAYQRNLLDRTFLFGGAAGYRMDSVWSFGVGGFLAYRSLSDQQESSCFRGGTPEQTSWATAQTNLNMAVASLMVSFGVKATLKNGLSFGATITSPSVRALSFADVTVTRNASDAQTKESSFVYEDLRGLRAQTKQGASLKVGAAYVLEDRATFVLDLSFYAPTEYQLYQLPNGKQSLQSALTINNRVKRNFIANFNLGAEWLVAKPFSISAGFFSNLSSAPAIPGALGDAFEAPALPRVNALGGSLVFGFFGGRYSLTRVGMTFSYGEGTDLVPRNQGASTLGFETEYVKSELSQLFLFFFLSSTFRY